MNAKDPLNVQRLVDGELSIEEIRQLLVTIESDSQEWKTIATQFIENQILQNEFGDLDSTSKFRFEASSAARSDATSFPHSWILSLAASVLLTLSIGFLIGSSFDSSGSNPALAGNPNHVSTVAGSSPSTPSVASAPEALHQSSVASTQPTNTPAVYRMQLQDEKGNRFVDTDIPFYQVNNFKDVGRHRFRDYPDEVRNDVLNSGYDLQQNTRYFNGKLKDGRQFVIPIRNTKFSPFQ